MEKKYSEMQLLSFCSKAFDNFLSKMKDSPKDDTIDLMLTMTKMAVLNELMDLIKEDK